MMCIRIVMEKMYNSSYSSVRNWYTIVSFSLFSFPLHYHFCYFIVNPSGDQRKTKQKKKQKFHVSKQTKHIYIWLEYDVSHLYYGWNVK